MPMHALHQEIIPPSGIEFATSLKLTPSTLDLPPSTSARHEIAARVLCNVVVARSNLLRIFEVREELAPVGSNEEEREMKGEQDGKDGRVRVRKGTEAVEGEAEMDRNGEGFVNIDKTSAKKTSVKTIAKFYHVREHRLHGIVTGMQGVKVVASIEDKLDRLLISFKDAKIALMEWSDAVHDLITVSIHTYERAPQLMSLDSSQFQAQLRVDPLSRCAGLQLPKDAIAILPFYQSQAELDVMDVDQYQSQTRDIPYSPSFILDLPFSVDKNIHHVIDFVFLPGFNNPTMALLFQPQQTWTGRLKEYKDTTRLIIFTLDITPQKFPIITSVEGLPHDALALIPCSTIVRGVVVITANSLIYIDQSSRRVVLPVNGWASRISDVPTQSQQSTNLTTTKEDSDREILLLEGSKAVFVDDRTLFLILRDGRVYPVELIVDGKTVSRFHMGLPLARTTIASLAFVLLPERSGGGGGGMFSLMASHHQYGKDDAKKDEKLLFIGSTVGDSVLLKAARVEEEVDDEDVEMALVATVVDSSKDIDMDEEDEEIYGPSKKIEQETPVESLTVKPKRTRSVIHLSLADSIPAHGPITDMAFSLATNGDRPVPELVAATGSGHLGGFSLFQRDLPIRTKRRLHAIGGARGMWSLPIRQPLRAEQDTLLLSTDAIPSPGLSRIASRSQKSDFTITMRIPGTTIGAAPFFQRTAILHVMTGSIRVMEPDGTERQVIKDTESSKNPSQPAVPRARIRACSISDPFVLIFREDDSIGLFIGEVERGKIRRKDMSMMGDKTSRYLTGCFFTDHSGVFEHNLQTGVVPPSASSEKNEKPTTTTLNAVVNDNKTQWLLLVRPQGVMEIWTLPKLTLVFSTSALPQLHPVLTDSHDPPANSSAVVQNQTKAPTEPQAQGPTSPTQEEPSSPKPDGELGMKEAEQSQVIEQVLVAPVGEGRLGMYFFVLLRSGQLAIYQALSYSPLSVTEPPQTPRASHLNVKFVKIISKTFSLSRHDSPGIVALAEQKKILRMFVPFVTKPTFSDSTYTGVFFTGENPSWVLGTDRGGLRMFPSGHGVVHAFTPCSLWDSKGDFLVYSDEGPSLLEWIPEFRLEGPLPEKSIPRGRAYSNIVFDPATSLIVAAASLEAKFALFDEDNNRVWEPDASNVSDPTTECSTLELISPDLWVTMDGYEFATNEVVNAVTVVTLETSSTETGNKQFIAVGTTINRGEDLATKGATYIFEIVEVVPDPSLAPKRWYKLRLRCRDDAKGPVTALCAFNGYLVSSMGQKIFVRAFDLDERLVGVAFMDVGSVSFVAFQEDPYKLVLLGKDLRHNCVTNADFFFTDDDMTILTNDEEGIVRMYDYNPTDPTSDGRYLILRTEFNSQAEYRTTALIAHRTDSNEEIPQARLMCGATNGSLVSLTPVDEAVSKRLQLLQGQLTRNMQHVAGLNPRAFRIVRNDYFSRPLSKGIADGNLLVHFASMSAPRQAEMTRQIGTEVWTVLKDWISLEGPW
ncbi:cleavage factor protein [Dendrothele bispora CBS 962.96]|uniref:Cleavage factor protein n=1 Tax=Dendrothele bispora (strain CBS 962.96) TaxID=1314807 RepID=A0A4S8M1M2_DENBC|nr:cleavage factor protein [Dendrothele bispora CBS 962.96]